MKIVTVTMTTSDFESANTAVNTPPMKKQTAMAVLRPAVSTMYDAKITPGI